MGQVDGIPLNCNRANSNLDRKQNVGTQLTCNEPHFNQNYQRAVNRIRFFLGGGASCVFNLGWICNELKWDHD